jgi:hypothetical protein
MTLPPITEEWFVGFADGEGCFTIRVDTPTRGPNAGRRQAHVRFEINQALRDAAVIEHVHAFFGFGRVDLNTSAGRLCQWRVLRQADLEAMVKLFDRIPLRTIKRLDYTIWREAVAVKARMKGGVRGHGGANEEAWIELERLTAQLRELRAMRRGGAAAPSGQAPRG